MTKEITLSLGERLASIKILNEFKGELSVLAVILEDIKKINITEEEWTNADLKKEKNPDGTETWKWQDTEKQEKTITIDQTVADYIAKAIDEKSKAGNITVADVALITLQKKLK